MTISRTLILAAMGLLLSGTAVAAVYKSVDADGNVVYTDEPVGDAKPIDLPPLSTIPPPRYVPPVEDAAPGDAEAESYKTLNIVSPIPDETLRDNTGDVPVRIMLAPELNSAAGHRLQYYLDGQSEGKPTNALQNVYRNIDRGTHTVEVAVVNNAGKELKRSEAVRFYLHRQSINFPRGPGSPAPFGGN